jgi:hypothetical protein
MSGLQVLIMSPYSILEALFIAAIAPLYSVLHFQT